MSRRYAASERIWLQSAEYGCMVSVIPGRELVYQYDSPAKERAKTRHVYTTDERVSIIANYLREHGEATVGAICDNLDMGNSAVQYALDNRPEMFQSRHSARGRNGGVRYLWSLREVTKKIGS